MISLMPISDDTPAIYNGQEMLVQENGKRKNAATPIPYQLSYKPQSKFALLKARNPF